METHLFKQIEEGTLDFAGIEQIMWRALLSLFQHFMEKILVEIDKYLMATRDPARYEFKERKCRTIETLVGPVEVERRYYRDRKSTRLNSSHVRISYAVFCLKKKKKKNTN